METVELRWTATVEVKVTVSVLDGQLTIDQVAAINADGKPVTLALGTVYIDDELDQIAEALSTDFDIEGDF